jgi:hypothetical protein
VLVDERAPADEHTAALDFRADSVPGQVGERGCGRDVETALFRAGDDRRADRMSEPASTAAANRST